MKWLPKSGMEIDAGVLRRLQTFFDRLAERYPDRVVIHFNRDHKKLAERGTALRRLAGYGEDNDAFFADFGFQYINALRRQAESHGTYEELVDRLRAAYPDGIVNLYEAEPFRADLSYFARKKRRTAKHILRQAGVLRSRRRDEAEDALDEVLEEIAPVVEEAAPVVEEATPVVEEAAPVVEETVPVVEEAAPAIEEAVPAAEEAAPAPDNGARRDELRRELAALSAERKKYTGLRALFGGAKKRRTIEARIAELEAELRRLD